MNQRQFDRLTELCKANPFQQCQYTNETVLEAIEFAKHIAASQVPDETILEEFAHLVRLFPNDPILTLWNIATREATGKGVND